MTQREKRRKKPKKKKQEEKINERDGQRDKFRNVLQSFASHVNVYEEKEIHKQKGSWNGAVEYKKRRERVGVLRVKGEIRMKIERKI